MASTNGIFIYLIGFAGTGKLTIAKALRQQFDCLLVDNHLINNVVFSLIDPDGKTPLPAEVWSRVAEVRGAALATIRGLSKPGRSFVFTNELLHGIDRHAGVFKDVQETAQARGARLLVVRLHVEPDELARRVVSPERAQAFKEIDAQGALQRSRQHELLKPDGADCLDLDVTLLAPDEAARRILQHVA
jgi:ribose 1,5-bisphosphokinase PhnN